MLNFKEGFKKWQHAKIVKIVKRQFCIVNAEIFFLKYGEIKGHGVEFINMLLACFLYESTLHCFL